MEPRDIIYRYDGSLTGFYCCVHASIYGHELPWDIQPDTEPQISLLQSKTIPTNLTQAAKVRKAIHDKISQPALELCEHVFLSCLVRKEIAILQFLVAGFETGAGIMSRLTDPAIDPLLRAERHLLGEAHLLTGFIRFKDHDSKLMATITPKNFVLPLLIPHFTDRYAMETFLIHDKTHQAALVYANRRAELAWLDGELPNGISETEQYHQDLWRQFYQTIGIKERNNPRCRMTHMPKRYWENMIELQLR